MPQRKNRSEGSLATRRIEPGYGQPHDRKGIPFQAGGEVAAGQGRCRIQAPGNNTVRFALNVWAGWAPIVLANNGFKAGQEWTAGDGEKFKVELVLIDNPVAMRDAYAAARFRSAGRRSIWFRCSSRASSTRRAIRARARMMPGSTSRSISRTAATGSWSRKHQDRRRPARQEDRAGAELSLALLCAQHAGFRWSSTARSPYDLHGGRLPGGGRIQFTKRKSPPVCPGRLTFTTFEDQGQPPAGDDPGRQPADRRRLVRPR